MRPEGKAPTGKPCGRVVPMNGGGEWVFPGKRAKIVAHADRRRHIMRHISDRDHCADGSERLVQFARIERQAGLPPQAKELQKRPENRQNDARTKAFVDIERKAARRAAKP
jgi:hypothetical protein